MAASDYFYRFENFIGYTGDLDDNPTLYFMDKTHYGRITTAHANPKNVGRASPKLLVGYNYGNKDVRGMRLVEQNKRLMSRHRSRNVLVDCTAIGERSRVRPRVLQLIAANTKVKEKDDDASRALHEFRHGSYWQNRLQ